MPIYLKGTNSRSLVVRADSQHHRIRGRDSLHVDWSTPGCRVHVARGDDGFAAGADDRVGVREVVSEEC